MKIAVVGTGYVGLVTGTCFAEMGNRVWCVDVDATKIDALNEGEIPIYEPGLSELVLSNRKHGHLSFTTSLEIALKESTICFIAVGTPMGEDGSADLRYVEAVAKEIGQIMTHPLYVVDKSTVPVGTATMVRETIQRELEKRGVEISFDVISNPEFLKEGTAIVDCMKPDRVIIGTGSEAAAAVMRDLYDPFLAGHEERFILMDTASAEMTKYAANAMLATKISFMNEMAGICERVGANVNKVRLGIGSDPRIGYRFIYPGCGYGGSCFPKDVQALIWTSKEHGYAPRILEAVDGINHRQKRVLAEKIVRRFGEDLTGLRFAVWGLAFKPDTDDMREAPSITIIEELTQRGAEIVAYDPKAAELAKKVYLKNVPRVSYVESKYEAVKGADALVLVTEWKEFRQPDFDEIKKLLRAPLIFDGRNQYDSTKMKKLGIEYWQIGVA